MLFSNFDKSSIPMYTMVVDAGSTGSRLHIFKFNVENNKLTNINEIGSKKVKPGLSSYASHPDDVYNSYIELFEFAKSTIPNSEQYGVSMYVYATAGMRLLPNETQNAIFDNIYNGYIKSSYPFVLLRQNLKTITGKDEAFYGWLAANFLGGSVTAKLTRVKNTIGSLDLGGASTQILFEPEETKLTDPLDPNNVYINKL